MRLNLQPYCTQCSVCAYQRPSARVTVPSVHLCQVRQASLGAVWEPSPTVYQQRDTHPVSLSLKFWEVMGKTSGPKWYGFWRAYKHTTALQTSVRDMHSHITTPSL